jgi:hypothetical protein
MLLAADSRTPVGFKVRLAFPVLRAELVAREREGPIARLGYGPVTSGSTSTMVSGSRCIGPVQEPQQVLGESRRVQDVGDVLLSRHYQPLCIG